jgi:hypothetical protein
MRGSFPTSWRSLVIAVSLVACHKARSAEVADGQVEGVESDSQEGATPAPVLAPSRCHAVKGSFAIDDGHEVDGLEVGDAIQNGKDVAVGVVHRALAGRVAAVALVRPDGDEAPRIVDLGPTPGDAPPPGFARRSTDLLAAAYAVSGGTARSKGRQLALYSVMQDKAVRLGAIDQAWDDSFAFDLASALDRTLVVWDEASGAGHGVVRAANIAPDGHAGPAHDVSPPDSDAELPRVLATNGGFAVFWIARGPAAGGPSADASALEVAGESIAPGWLETLNLDANGSPTGTVRRLTPASGHVSTYDLAAIGPSTGATILVVARDDGEGSDESGGQLLRVRVTGDAVEASAALATDGLGRGAPALVGGPAPWLSWVARDESLRLMALDVAGAPLGLAGSEPSLDEARPLMVMSTAPRGVDRVLAAFPGDANAQLRVFECAR